MKENFLRSISDIDKVIEGFVLECPKRGIIYLTTPTLLCSLRP